MSDLSKENLESKIISVFGENGYPEYSQGMPTNELQEYATAEQLNNMVKEFVLPELQRRAWCKESKFPRY